MPRPVIQECVFENNNALCRGGAIAISAGAPVIQGCEFRNNSAAFGGGAIFCKMTDGLRVEDCQFYGNDVLSGNSGGAILAGWTIDDDQDSLTPAEPIRIIGCTFGPDEAADPGNNAGAGGAVMIVNADCTISHNKFMENTANGIDVGGTSLSRGAALGIVGLDSTAPGTLGEALGITIDPTDTVKFSARVTCNQFAANSFFSGTPTADRAAVWVGSSDVSLHSVSVDLSFVNNTVTSHPFASLLVAEGTSGSGKTSSVKASIRNSILWDPTYVTHLLTLGSPGIAASYNNSNQDLSPYGTNNLQVNPLLVGAPSDVNLSSGSPCIEVGSNREWLLVRAKDPSIPNQDLDGGPRVNPNNGDIDIGCQEF